jgi:hypothetical protein
MQRKTLLVTLVIVAVLASVLLYFLLQPKAPTQPTQPAQPVTNATKPQQSQNATQAQPQAKPPMIMARIDVGKGGRILVNGSETVVWNSTRPFKLELEAVPDRCMVLDYWLVNGTDAGSQPRLSLTIAGNTTVKAVFTRPLYTVTIIANYTRASAAVNGTTYSLPQSLVVPACVVLKIEPLETVSIEPINTTTTLTVLGDTAVILLYKLKTRYDVWAYINGTLQPVEVYEPWFVKNINNGTISIEDGWMHINGNLFLLLYIPWNYTHVVIEGKNVTGSVIIYRICEWGTDPYAYGTSINFLRHRIEFSGCQVVGMKPYECDRIGGRRDDFEKPGALILDIHGEVWLKIEAYPQH